MITKTIVVAITTLVCITGYAETKGQTKQQMAVELIQLRQKFINPIDSLPDGLPILNAIDNLFLPQEATDAAHKAASKTLTEFLNPPELVADIASYMAESYTEDELRKILEFSKSDVGQKMLKTDSFIQPRIQKMALQRFQGADVKALNSKINKAIYKALKPHGVDDHAVLKKHLLTPE